MFNSIQYVWCILPCDNSRSAHRSCPALNRGEGDEHDAFASFTLEFETLAANLGDELPAFATRLAYL